MGKNNNGEKRRIRKNNFLVFVILLGILISGVFAAIPQTLNLHGKLTNSSDSALTGTYNMSFRLYNVTTGGTILWTENHSVDVDSVGIYNVILNNMNLTFDNSYYLGIVVGTDPEMIPRINLTSTPYTFRAQNTTIDGIEINSDLNMGNYNITIGGGWRNGGLSFLGGDIYARVLYVYNITSLNITKQNLTILEDLNVEGNVGIGSPSSAYKLEVTDAARALNVSGVLYVNGSSGQVGIGTPFPDPTKTLNVYGKAVFEEEADYGEVQIEVFSNTDWEGGFFVVQRSRGTRSSFDAVQDGDYIIYLDAQAYDGNSWERVGQIQGVIDGTVSDNKVPMKWNFNTMNSGGSYATRMTITDGGNVGIGNTNPNSSLNVFYTGAYTTTPVLNITGNNYPLAVFKRQATGGAAQINIVSGEGYEAHVGVTSTGMMDFDAKMYINQSSGDVGIGVATPTSPLEIHDSTDSQIKLLKTTTGDTVGSLLAWDTGFYIGTGIYYDNGWLHLSSGTNNELFVFEPGSGVKWYASSDSAASWNIANAEVLWTAGGDWYNRLASVQAGDSYITGGDLGIGTNSPTHALNVVGYANITLLGGDSATHICWDGGVLTTCSSSERYKENIINTTASSAIWTKYMQLQPVRFNFINKSEQHLGLIAEDVYDLFPNYVFNFTRPIYEENITDEVCDVVGNVTVCHNITEQIIVGYNNQIEGINYDSLTTANLMMIQDLREKNVALRSCILNSNTLAEIKICVEAIE